MTDHLPYPVDLYGPCKCGMPLVESDRPGVVWEHAPMSAHSAEITGSMAFWGSDEDLQKLMGEPRYDLIMSMHYQWTWWDRTKNAILRFLRLEQERLPETYEVKIPGAKITSLSKSDDRISVDWKL